MPTQIFISHITEDAAVATRLKLQLLEDFLDQFTVFQSSDTESIAAGENWFSSISKAIRDSSLFVILCSPIAVTRPWVNFEAGAAWMRDLPLIPACLHGLRPRDLVMPLSAYQGLELNDAQGLQRLYGRIAATLSCRSPAKDYTALATEFGSLPRLAQDGPDTTGQESDKAIRSRLDEALSHPGYKWRSLDKVAAVAAISVDRATALLRADERVRFSRGKNGSTIVGLRSRVGDSNLAKRTGATIEVGHHSVTT
jgi:hypothetical protein